MAYTAQDAGERAALDRLWQQATQRQQATQQRGMDRLAGREAVQFLTTCGLPREVLRTVWELADNEKRHFLEKAQFDVAVRLICVAAAGMDIEAVGTCPGKSLPLPGPWQHFAAPRQVPAPSAESGGNLVKPKFKKHDRVAHTRTSDGLVRRGVVVGVHTDDAVNGIYYTVRLDQDNHELQAAEHKLRHEAELDTSSAREEEQMQPSQGLVSLAQGHLQQQQHDWSIDAATLQRYRTVYASAVAKQATGRIDMSNGYAFFRQSGLDDASITRILQMCDLDRDNILNEIEFCLAFHIAVGVSKRGWPLPAQLPNELHQLYMQLAQAVRTSHGELAQGAQEASDVSKANSDEESQTSVLTSQGGSSPASEARESAIRGSAPEAGAQHPTRDDGDEEEIVFEGDAHAVPEKSDTGSLGDDPFSAFDTLYGHSVSDGTGRFEFYAGEEGRTFPAEDESGSHHGDAVAEERDDGGSKGDHVSRIEAAERPMTEDDKAEDDTDLQEATQGSQEKRAIDESDWGDFASGLSNTSDRTAPPDYVDPVLEAAHSPVASEAGADAPSSDGAVDGAQSEENKDENEVRREDGDQSKGHSKNETVEKSKSDTWGDFGSSHSLSANSATDEAAFANSGESRSDSADQANGTTADGITEPLPPDTEAASSTQDILQDLVEGEYFETIREYLVKRIDPPLALDAENEIAFSSLCKRIPRLASAYQDGLSPEKDRLTAALQVGAGDDALRATEEALAAQQRICARAALADQVASRGPVLVQQWSDVLAVVAEECARACALVEGLRAAERNVSAGAAENALGSNLVQAYLEDVRKMDSIAGRVSAAARAALVEEDVSGSATTWAQHRANLRKQLTWHEGEDDETVDDLALALLNSAPGLLHESHVRCGLTLVPLAAKDACSFSGATFHRDALNLWLNRVSSSAPVVFFSGIAKPL